ncbi:hypothetical protein, partial [Robiginitalea aurantiaca]
MDSCQGIGVLVTCSMPGYLSFGAGASAPPGTYSLSHKKSPSHFCKGLSKKAATYSPTNRQYHRR